jgi:hypothetical protein
MTEILLSFGIKIKGHFLNTKLLGIRWRYWLQKIKNFKQFLMNVHVFLFKNLYIKKMMINLYIFIIFNNSVSS